MLETHPRKRARLEDEQTTEAITSKVIPDLGYNAQSMSHRIGEERFPIHPHSLQSSPYIEPSPILSHAQWTGPAESNPLQRSTSFAIRVKVCPALTHADRPMSMMFRLRHRAHMSSFITTTLFAGWLSLLKIPGKHSVLPLLQGLATRRRAYQWNSRTHKKMMRR